ncbi:PDDEXK nuclease domain-containing protein [Niabella pedocola]|uniref:PDDEXK nuclease domain-containing protein n=1 Tax=Niabella pedocola TaxID=1752077 RepID=A0ABS8PRQ7_9BACT|nr:PDDEXK nuclease domain-containing protein [Niabella pedocola]MCD2423764.1 PDDEXK nuclease domain-containing protein [Niabella pedocola]
MNKTTVNQRKVKSTPPEKCLSPEQTLFTDLSQLIDQSQHQFVQQANSALTMLFWHIGKRINEDILENRRAGYGKQIVPALAAQLKTRYGRNFEEKNLRRMLQFAEQFPSEEIVVTASRQLSWSHILVLLPLKNRDAQLYYARTASDNMLSVRALRHQIAIKEYERTTIANLQNTSNHPALQNNFKDPYFLDFLGLQNTYLEKDLEAAILKELETFILELGNGFAFVDRRKRMVIDGEDFYLDLLFYHRVLKRLVAIELKLGKFEAKHKGQMELYLRWLGKYEKQEGEFPPVGLILCTESSREQIELLEMHKDGIMVAEYWTELPPKKELEKKIHHILIKARERIENNRLLE